MRNKTKLGVSAKRDSNEHATQGNGLEVHEGQQACFGAMGQQYYGILLHADRVLALGPPP